MSNKEIKTENEDFPLNVEPLPRTFDESPFSSEYLGMGNDESFSQNDSSDIYTPPPAAKRFASTCVIDGEPTRAVRYAQSYAVDGRIDRIDHINRQA
eukprot:Nk52_evm1s2246 gene=Nk52_evmTU1s2246